jgi:hypothetical protein
LNSIVGIDWASEGKNRAHATIACAGPAATAHVVEVAAGCSDAAFADILAREPRPAVIAVDIPFGWPRRFADFVSAWRPSPPRGAAVPRSEDFRYRRTDLVVRDALKKHPLSVSSDRIALATRAWVDRVAALGLADHIDVGLAPAAPPPAPRIIEVYPAGTLKALGAESAGYRSGRKVRRAVVEAVLARFQLACEPAHLETLTGAGEEDADPADALIAAVTGLLYLAPRAGWSVRRPSSAEERDRAVDEGWIFFPERAPAPAP